MLCKTFSEYRYLYVWSHGVPPRCLAACSIGGSEEASAGVWVSLLQDAQNVIQTLISRSITLPSSYLEVVGHQCMRVVLCME